MGGNPLTRRRARCAALAALLLAGAAPAVAWAAADMTVLQVFVHEGGSYLEDTKVFFEAFERAHPEIKIEIVPGPAGSSPEEKLSIMVAAGLPPDLARLWNTKQAAKAGLLQEITPYFERLPPEDQNDLWPPIREALSVDGKLYALPLGTAVGTYFFNPRLFAERGVGYPDDAWAWEVEGVQELRKLTVDRDGDGRPDVWAMVRAGGQGYHVYSFIYSAGGGPLFNEAGTQFLGNNAATVEALQFLYDLAHVHNVMPATGSSYTDFINESAASMLWGSFMVGYFDPFPDLAWDIAQIPTFRGNRATSLWPETPYGIPQGAKHPDEAWQVLKFIYSREGQTLAMEMGWGIPPARASVAQTAFVRAFPQTNIDALIKMLQSPLNQPTPQQAPSQATSLLVRAFQDVIAGVKAPRQAIEEVDAAIQAILAESAGR